MAKIEGSASDVIYNYSHTFYEERLRDSRELDAKAQALILFAGVQMLCLFLILLVLYTKTTPEFYGATNTYIYRTSAIHILVLVFVIWESVQVIKVGTVEDLVSPDKVLKTYEEECKDDPVRLQEMLAHEYSRASNEYVHRNNKKGDLLKYAQRWFQTSAVMLVITVVIYLLFLF